MDYVQVLPVHGEFSKQEYWKAPPGIIPKCAYTTNQIIYHINFFFCLKCQIKFLSKQYLWFPSKYLSDVPLVSLSYVYLEIPVAEIEAMLSFIVIEDDNNWIVWNPVFATLRLLRNALRSGSFDVYHKAESQ